MNCLERANAIVGDVDPSGDLFFRKYSRPQGLLQAIGHSSASFACADDEDPANVLQVDYLFAEK
jgi:hypothetical protein